MLRRDFCKLMAAAAAAIDVGEHMDCPDVVAHPSFGLERPRLVAPVPPEDDLAAVRLRLQHLENAHRSVPLRTPRSARPPRWGQPGALCLAGLVFARQGKLVGPAGLPPTTIAED